MTFPEILCQSGEYFDFTDPEGSNFTVNDVAHALSNICRFTGHAHRFYSVAEHSVHASRIVPEGFELEALVHDATEAFIGDVAKPLKMLLPDYQRLERRIERIVLSRFGIKDGLSAVVKRADMQMLKAEQEQAMLNHDRWHPIADLEPAEVELQFWTPEVARQKFCERYDELSF